MRTRSGSLAAVMARVPSHPAHSGVLCICAANASSRSGTRRMRYPGFNTAEGQQALFAAHHRCCKYRAWLAFALRQQCRQLQYWRWCWNAGPQLTRDANTAVGTAALLLNSAGSRNTAVGTAALVNTAGDADGNGSFNGAFGAFALNANVTGFSNNAVGDSAMFRNHQLPLRIQLLVILRWRIMTQVDTACELQLCFWRSGARGQC